MAQLKAKLDSEWQAKLDMLSNSQNDNLQQTLNDAYKTHKTAIDQLTKEYEEQLLLLKNTLQKEANDARETQIELENQSLKWENLYQEEKKLHATNISAQEQRHQDIINALESKHKKELDGLRKDMMDDYDSKYSDIEGRYKQEKMVLIKEHEDILEKLNKTHEEELLNKSYQLETLHKQQMNELQLKYENNQREKLEMLSKKHESEMNNMNQDHHKEKQQWGVDMNVIQDNLSNANKLNIEQNKEMEKNKMDYELKYKELKNQMMTIQQECDSKIRMEKEGAERRILEANDRNAMELKTLKMEFREDCQKFEERMQLAKVEYEKLLNKYNNRDSRPEDIAKIKDLEDQMIEKDALVAKTREEMNYFKREMLNREEGYNKKFNVAPVVGVLDPTANKKKNGSSKAPGGFGGSSNAPTNIVGSNSGMNMGGMGLNGGGIAGGMSSGGSIRTQSK